MSQVAELEQSWRETAGLLADATTPWEKIRELSDHASGLGVELITTPCADLSDLAIKVQWLAGQDLDTETTKQALRQILKDIRRLQRQ